MDPLPRHEPRGERVLQLADLDALGQHVDDHGRGRHQDRPSSACRAHRRRPPRRRSPGPRRRPPHRPPRRRARHAHVTAGQRLMEILGRIDLEPEAGPRDGSPRSRPARGRDPAPTRAASAGPRPPPPAAARPECRSPRSWRSARRPAREPRRDAGRGAGTQRGHAADSITASGSPFPRRENDHPLDRGQPEAPRIAGKFAFGLPPRVLAVARGARPP